MEQQHFQSGLGRPRLLCVEALFSCAVGRLRYMLKMHGSGEWRFGVGEHGRDRHQKGDMEIAGTFKTKAHRGGKPHGRHTVYSSGDTRRTSQRLLKAPSTSNAWSRMAELEMKIRLPLFAFQAVRSRA